MNGDDDDSAVMTLSNFNTELEIEEVILRLDLTLVKPDDDDTARKCANDNDDDVAAPSVADNDEFDETEDRMTTNGHSETTTTDDKAKTSKSQADGGNNRQHDDDRKRSKPLDFIRKLRQTTDSHRSGASSDNASRRKSPEPLKVDNLPQSFIAKYVGCKSCRGLWGIQHTRQPVDTLVDDIRRLERGDDLPLVRLDVSVGGIGVVVHPRSRSRRPVHDLGLLPLEFISYAVQDTRYSRIFAFILVRELSSRGRLTECHAYLCDSAVSARKLALSVALAFRLYERSLAGKPFRFTVDLRSPEQLAAEHSQSKSKSSASKSGSASPALAAECDT